MESDHPETVVTNPSGAQVEPGGATPEGTPAAPSDPASLVDRLIETPDWPDPALLEQIAAAGEPALGPLLEFMRTYPTEYERENALYYGIVIVGATYPPAAIPVLAEIIRRYPEDIGESAAQALGEFGAPAFEAALELVRDREMTGYPRQYAINAARQAAGTDPGLRARLADVLRPLLADAMERTREMDRQDALESNTADDEDPGRWTVEDLEDEDDLEESYGDEEELSPGDVADEAEAAGAGESAVSSKAGELEPYEEVMFLVSDLADLADPQARDLIKTAFEEDLVETFWVDEKSVEESYREGGTPPRPPRDWLGEYREQYLQRMEDLKRPRPPGRSPQQTARPASYREPPYEPPPPPETIRNTGPKLGRNDPCWCGSGKKYKKCHWGKDDLK